MKTLKLLLALALSVTLALGVMTAIQSCSKDDEVPTRKIKMTMTCTQKEICNEYTRFDVLCESETSVYSVKKFFYVDTVPYSRIMDEYQHQWREGEMAKNSIEWFRPKRNAYIGHLYSEEEGEMVVTHPFDRTRKYYIGAYTVSASGRDTVWSEPFVYDAPVNPSIGATYKLTGLTANSATFTLKFSREVTSEEFEIIACWIGDDDKKLIPFEGKVNELKVTFDGLMPNTNYSSGITVKLNDQSYVKIPTVFFTTPAE